LRLQSQVDLDQLASHNERSEPIEGSELTNMSQKSLSTIPCGYTDRHEGFPSSSGSDGLLEGTMWKAA
jgi:hypothetical protein